MTEQPRSVLQSVTPEVIAEARELIAGANHAALACLEPGTGHPLASRIGLATLADGTPIATVSRLAAHSAALEADPRCSLLIGEPGKGDPLAHPRLTLICRAVVISPEGLPAARERYLARHPRAGIYLGLPDFRFLGFAIERASFNAGFGRAYALEGAALTG